MLYYYKIVSKYMDYLNTNISQNYISPSATAELIRYNPGYFPAAAKFIGATTRLRSLELPPSFNKIVC